MHRWLASELSSLDKTRGQRLAVIGPRGNAKSTWSTVCHPLRAACEGIEPYIWIISDTADQAWGHLANLRVEIEDNEALAEAYPHAIRGAKCRAASITLGNGCLIEALGTGQKIRGRRKGASRPSLVILDDPENDEQVRSPTQREYHWNWFNDALLKAGTKTTNFIVLGSALHRDSLLMQLTRNPGWKAKKFSSIESWPTNMQLWAEWEEIYCNVENPNKNADAQAFFEANIEQMTEGAVVVWPDFEPLYALMCQRAEEGHASFEREKQGNPINQETCEWPEAYFGPHIWADEWPKREDLALRVVFLDPSKGADSSHGDYSAIVWCGVGRDGLIYIDADLQRRTTDQIVVDYVAIAKGFLADACGIETNVFQQLLAQDIEEAGAAAGFPLPIIEVENRVNKEVRIRRIGPYLAQRRLRFRRRSPGCALLISQMQDFPNGDHDDGPDALEGCFRIAAQLEGQAGGEVGHIDLGFV